MRLTINTFIPACKILFLLLCVINTTCGRQFPGNGYSLESFYPAEVQYEQIKKALSLLEPAPQWVPNWPDSSVKLGQVSGVAIDNTGQLLVFHRASNVWDENTFTLKNVYNGIGTEPIPHPTILVLNDTGELLDMWGQNMFYIPHGITVDHAGNVWTTDVALHQVFKFEAGKRNYSMVLGQRFEPGSNNYKFCKPSAVAVLKNGDFFVADGYCNHRIIKFAPDGTIILQWGTAKGDSPFVMNVPHALALAEERGLVLVADRERGRVAAFRADNGSYATAYRSWLIGGRLFSVAYSPVHGGRLYVVNGPGSMVPVRGYVIDFTTGKLIQTFAPDGDFSNPHDIVTSPSGDKVYVAELNPFKVYKFIDEVLGNETREEKANVHVKPTATIEVYGSPVPMGEEWDWWRGAAGGAGAAALLALAAFALLRARNTGRKGVTRRRWEYGQGEFKLRRLLERRRFTRVHSDDSDDEPAPMLPHHHPPANA
ncbi:hypothetical protein K1T71_001656 [Dendrolimus kikuchii]|uniref:Uncharacterized protein n=1 Tax=Dendrolimus kikuchii TaxID=765133 RepID=A0ACC1DFT2_9NEOP|nr:hypothetical protein K1T71_001656 [Dendrolimus kikuchii]